jgi:phosphate transport system permease protein
LNDVLLSAPSILIGLFVYELLVRPFHGFSAAAGAVALAFLATPLSPAPRRTFCACNPTSCARRAWRWGRARAM